MQIGEPVPLDETAATTWVKPCNPLTCTLPVIVQDFLQSSHQTIEIDCGNYAGATSFATKLLSGKDSVTKANRVVEQGGMKVHDLTVQASRRETVTLSKLTFELTLEHGQKLAKYKLLIAERVALEAMIGASSIGSLSCGEDTDQKVNQLATSALPSGRPSDGRAKWSAASAVAAFPLPSLKRSRSCTPAQDGSSSSSSSGAPTWTCSECRFINEAVATRCVGPQCSRTLGVIGGK